MKLNMLLPYDPEIMLFGIYPKELKANVHNVHTKTYTWIFIEALFIIVKIWTQPRFPSTG